MISVSNLQVAVEVQVSVQRIARTNQTDCTKFIKLSTSKWTVSPFKNIIFYSWKVSINPSESLFIFFHYHTCTLYQKVAVTEIAVLWLIFFSTYFHQWWCMVASLMQMLNGGNLGFEVTCLLLSCWTYSRSGSLRVALSRWADVDEKINGETESAWEGRPFLDINQAVSQPKHSTLISLF